MEWFPLPLTPLPIKAGWALPSISTQTDLIHDPIRGLQVPGPGAGRFYVWSVTKKASPGKRRLDRSEAMSNFSLPLNCAAISEHSPPLGDHTGRGARWVNIGHLGACG